VPIKARLTDTCTGLAVTDTSGLGVSIKVTNFTGSVDGNVLTDSVEQYADAGASNGNTLALRWTADATFPPGFWIYNLDSKSVGGQPLALGATYKVQIKVGTIVADPTYALLSPVK
jgi:hypothetical protein